MIYNYIAVNSPNLDNLEFTILSSTIAETYIYFNWDSVDQILKVHLNRELTIDEKLILDNIIDFPITKPEPIPVFSVETFLYRLSEEFDVLQRMNLAGVAPSFTSELQFQNFEGIKEILDYLLSTLEITQETVDKITSLFLEQNIDLNNL